MDRYWLTRQELASLLRSLESNESEKPSTILRKAWMRNQRGVVQDELFAKLPETPLPSIAEKLMRCGERRGFSLHEIAELGHFLEFSTLSVTSMQNWVKRDFKMYVHSPQAGKKYSLDQTALLLMIDDLKANLDFDSIRRLFTMLFRQCDDTSMHESACITPLSFLEKYTSLYEVLNRRKVWDTMNAALLELTVWEEAAKTADAMTTLPSAQKEALRNMLFVAVISVQAARLQALARRYCQAALYMKES